MELRDIISALVEAADTCVDDRSGSPMQVAEWDEAIEAGRKWLANPESGKPVSQMSGCRVLATTTMRTWQSMAGEDAPENPMLAIVEQSPAYDAVSITVGNVETRVEQDAKRGIVVRVWRESEKGEDPDIEQEFPIGEITNPNSNACDVCGDKVQEVIGCPNGIEVCQDCFNNTAAG